MGFVGSEGQFLTDVVLLLCLPEGEIGEREVILIHVHVVFEKLVGGGAAEDIVAYGEGVAAAEDKVMAEVGASVVSVDGEVGQMIGEAALTDIVVTEEGGVAVTAGIAAVNTYSGTGFVRRVNRLAVVLVSEEPVGVAIVGCGSYSPFGLTVEALVHTEFGFGIVTVAVADGGTKALPVERGEGLYGHNAADGISPEESALRSAGNADRADIEEVEVVGVFVGDTHTIDIQTEYGVVDAGSETTDVDGGGHSAAVVGYVEIGYETGEVFVSDALLLFELPHKDLGDGTALTLLYGCKTLVDNGNFLQGILQVGLMIAVCKEEQGQHKQRDDMQATTGHLFRGAKLHLFLVLCNHYLW